METKVTTFEGNGRDDFLQDYNLILQTAGIIILCLEMFFFHKCYEQVSENILFLFSSDY